jgi:hypothetical protein
MKVRQYTDPAAAHCWRLKEPWTLGAASKGSFFN